MNVVSKNSRFRVSLHHELFLDSPGTSTARQCEPGGMPRMGGTRMKILDPTVRHQFVLIDLIGVFVNARDVRIIRFSVSAVDHIFPSTTSTQYKYRT